MALHTGVAQQRDADYFGSTLNRVARLLSTGYGGQVLLYRIAYDLVRDHLPAGAGFKDLGEHRLRDLERPEHVFQLFHPDLPADFPALRSLEALPNNLPQQLTSFVGRETEIAQVKRLLTSTRLLTLTGPGGSGKTRLSLQVAADILEGYGEGVWQVELAPLADAALVPQAVAQVLGVKEETGRPCIKAITPPLAGCWSRAWRYSGKGEKNGVSPARSTPWASSPAIRATTLPRARCMRKVSRYTESWATKRALPSPS